MRKIISTLTFLVISASVSFGQVDNTYAKTLEKLFEVSGSEESYKAAIKQMATMFKQQYSDIDNEFWNDFEKEFLNTSLNDIVEMLVPVYMKYMTEEDLKEMINFYQTPIGIKYAKSTPLIMQESMQVGQQWGLKIGKEFQEKMNEKGY